MATKGKGLFGGLMDKIADELNEPDAAEQARSAKLDAPSVKAPSVTTSPVPLTHAPSVVPVYAPSANTPVESVDDDTIAMIRSSVFVESVNGHASEYMKFLQMWEALGKQSDFNAVVKALNVSDKAITPQGIRADFQAHQALLDTTIAETAASLDSTAQAALGDITQRADALRAQNDAAQKAIDQHMAEIAERNSQLAALATEESATKNKITRAQQRALQAQNTVRGELAAMTPIIN